MRTRTAKLYDWATEKAASDRAPFWLGLLFSLELFLLVPLDAVLMFFCLQKRSRIPLYVLIATAASVFTGVVGYLLGHFLWDVIGGWIVPHVIAPTTFERVASHLQTYESWAVIIGTLLPFPMKAISIVSGVFHLNLLDFIMCVAIGRLARFALVGGIIAAFGEKVKLFLDRHFHRIFLIIGAKTALAFALFWALANG